MDTLAGREPASPLPPDPQDTRLVIVVYDQAIEVNLLDCLDELELPHFTRWAGAQGSGRQGRREGTPVWPGLNNVLLMAIPPEMVRPLVERLYALRAEFPQTPALRILVSGPIQLY